ncbi:hypothetical protein J7E96_14135 [Streptomyces sp. ISL-96]|nr:hypothetical protein [Streptomyces sp. ISL-96]
MRSYLGVRDVGLDCVVWDLDSLDWCGGNEQDVADSVITQATEGASSLRMTAARASTRVRVPTLRSTAPG